MKMKLRIFSLLLVGLMAASAFAATIDQWQQNNTPSGNWNDPCMWKKSVVPVPSTATGDELKLNTNRATTTINTVQNYNNRLTIAGGSNDIDVHKVLLSANATFSEVRVGHGNSSDKGSWGLINQTGGTFNVKDLQLGYYGTRAAANDKGYYTISGGSLLMNAGTTGRIMVGTGITTGATSANNEGVFTVVGNDGTISMKELYVGATAGGAYSGKGTVEFKAHADGISKIVVSTSIVLDAGGASSIANLVVSRGASHGDLILVENTGASAVSGLFDSLNGGLAGEGQGITLGGAAYTLTYVYDASTGAHTGGNDIALIPEPATIALLSLGLIAIRRKK
jgi:hypothetical protein